MHVRNLKHKPTLTSHNTMQTTMRMTSARITPIIAFTTTIETFIIIIGMMATVTIAIIAIGVTSGAKSVPNRNLHRPSIWSIARKREM